MASFYLSIEYLNGSKILEFNPKNIKTLIVSKGKCFMKGSSDS